MYDINSEQVILGVLLLNPNYFEKIDSLIKPDFFYENLHKEIYILIKKTIEEQNIKDLGSIKGKIEYLSKKYLHEDNYLKVLLNLGSSVVEIEGYCNSIKNSFKKRELRKICMDAIKNIDSNKEFDYIINSLEKDSDLLEETEKNTKYELRSLQEICNNRISDIERTKKNGGTPENLIKTNIIDLDRLIGGIAKGNLTILAGRSSMGKALPLDTKILTNTGWVKNKDLKIGDHIIDPFGKETKVIGVFPQGIRQCYKLIFIDGREIEADENHLWEVFFYRWKKAKIINTKKLSILLNKPHYKNGLAIRFFSGEYGVEKDFLIHPYLLGVLLGDGSLQKTCRWCKPDLFIKEKIESLIRDDYRVSCQSSKKNIFAIVKKKKKPNKNLYIEELKKLELLSKRSNEKFIPEIYLHASMQQRLDLLNGLLDTDGGVVNKNGSVEYSTSSPILAKQVQQLAFSLGFRCRVQEGKTFLNGVQKRNRFRLVFDGKNYLQLFSTPVKKEKLNKNKRIRKYLTIVDCKKTTKKETQCIMVNNESHLYVAENYITTHNTSLSLQIALNISKQNYNVLFFSQEMCYNEQADKILSNLARLDSFSLKECNVNEQDMEKIKKVVAENKIKSLYINDSSGINAQDIRKTCRIFEKKYGKIDLIVVDHLQIMSDVDKTNNRVLELSNISMDCKKIAKDFNCGFLLLSQLSRKTEEREDHQPRIDDLRESGAIEQNADLILSIYRESYYIERELSRTKFEDDRFNELKRIFESVKNQVDLTILKNRNGKIGSVKLFFEPEFSNLTDVTGALLFEQYEKLKKV